MRYVDYTILVGAIALLVSAGCGDGGWSATPRSARGADATARVTRGPADTAPSDEPMVDTGTLLQHLRSGEEDPDDIARRDPVVLLRLAKAQYQRTVRDYTATLVKQRRAENGKLLPPETILCKVRRQPYSVFLAWSGGADRIDRALYAPGILGPVVYVHPTGLAGLLASTVKADPKGRYAEHLSRLVNFGFDHTLDLLITRATNARAAGHLTANSLGETVVDGRAAVAIQWLLPPGHGYPYGRIVITLCHDTLLPLTIAMWDWNEKLLASYAYRDLRTNVALTTDDFTLQACGLDK